MKLKKLMPQVLMSAAFLLLSSVYVSAQTRINFRRGTTSASVSGRLASGGSKTFVLSAKRGQTLTATVSSGNRSVYFVIGDGVNDFESFQTVAGNNYISIANASKRPTNFTLVVSIQ